MVLKSFIIRKFLNGLMSRLTSGHTYLSTGKTNFSVHQTAMPVSGFVLLAFVVHGRGGRSHVHIYFCTKLHLQLRRERGSWIKKRIFFMRADRSFFYHTGHRGRQKAHRGGLRGQRYRMGRRFFTCAVDARTDCVTMYLINSIFSF